MVMVMKKAEAQEPQRNEIVNSFVKSLEHLEQAHRRLLDVVKDDLERGGERLLTGVQALLLYEIGEGETPASALRSRGTFVGASMSYNMKKLQEAGYLEQARSKDDRRTVILRLTPRGLKVRERVIDMFERHASSLEPVASVREGDLETFNKTAQRLERFWSDQIKYQM